MTTEEHKHFVELSVRWCQLREEFHREGTSKLRRQEIRKRRQQIDQEQEALLQKEKSYETQ
ncbi:hypothetical protein [Pontibacter burrus]|uniref:Uncharacterized protein n=1 Tax=Pontibacter burrus TaxID=2704466 RepID=A0A6B3LRJ3_9BACT|nr:hypothetical protein [Pontibacter burrus]NEM96187.1 hypothetical protein [Pontibacter burrus]